MSTINTKAVTADEREAEESHLNWMGGQSFDISDPIARLRLAASSCFFGEPQYYSQDSKIPRIAGGSALWPEQQRRLRATLDAIDPQEWRGLDPATLMVRAIDAALDHDPEATLREAARLRHEEHIRATPQVILVRAANHPKVRGTGLVRKFAPTIIERADEPATGLAYQLAAYPGRPIPNSLKRAWRSALEGFTEYELAKYQMRDRKVKTVDVVNLVHPSSPAVAKLVRHELTNENATWEAIVSKEGSSKETWTKALGVMGHMALLRNLRNLSGHGVAPKLFLQQLIDGAKEGKQLPFRYLAAYRAIGEPQGQLRDAIEDCLKISLGNLPKFRGRTMSLCDNSGSAQSAATSTMGTMRVSSIANLTGIITGQVSEDGHVGIFGDRLSTFAVRKNASVFDQVEKAEKLASSIGQSTENGIWLFWKNAIDQKEHWDNIFIYSDMQAGHGGLYGVHPDEYRDFLWTDGRHIDVAKLIRQYRAKVNPNVNVFLVQVAGYQDTLVPEYYKRTYILGGWGEGLLRFAASMARLTQ